MKLQLCVSYGHPWIGLMDILSVCTGLSQDEIDVRVKLICEKSPSPNVVAPRILAVVPAEEKMERLKVIKD